MSTKEPKVGQVWLMNVSGANLYPDQEPPAEFGRRDRGLVRIVYRCDRDFTVEHNPTGTWSAGLSWFDRPDSILVEEAPGD